MQSQFGNNIQTAFMLYILGLNHETAPVEIRERLSFGPDIIVAALRGLGEQAGVSESVILSTCNRTEIYCVTDEHGLDSIRQWICNFHGLQIERVSPYLYQHIDDDAINHLLRVACGLDSMVLGEPQILGQVKEAWNTSRNANACGKLLDRLFQHSFSVAKQVRSQTSIGSSPVSVAFAAVTLAKQIFTDLHDQTALLIGAGETIELAARHLHQRDIGHLIIANRTVGKAQILAKMFNGFAISLPEIHNHLYEADIVISSTASPLPILGKGSVESALKKRRHKPIFMVDIAVPRDIETEVGTLQDIYLYSVDDLKEVIEENKKSRLQAAEQAQEIIDQQVTEFRQWLQSLDAVDLISSYRKNAEQARDEILQRALNQLKNNKNPEDTLRFLAHTLTNRLLHNPCTAMREAGATSQTEFLEAVNKLFKIN